MSTITTKDGTISGELLLHQGFFRDRPPRRIITSRFSVTVSIVELIFD
jgi:hypothetical protein